MKREALLIEADELLNKLDSPNLRIYDATIMFYMDISPEEAAKMPTAYEQYQAGHIPGAAFFDHEKYSNLDSKYEYMRASDAVLAEQIGKAGISKDSEVILYTSHNILATATRAWWLLHYAGVENVRVLNGGLAAWQEAGGKLETKENHYLSTTFTPHFNPRMFASKEEVLAAHEDATVRVENTLPQDWHDREHIPNSVCVPLTLITEEWKIFLPDSQIQAILGDNDDARRIITYCGGGIAATVNAMAYLLLGHEDVAVYDGSLYEWTGEGLPLESSHS